MIAVLQNSIGTAPLQYPGADTLLPEQAVTAEDAFLLVFEHGDVAAQTAKVVAPESVIKSEQTTLLEDSTDLEPDLSPDGYETAIWQFQPQFIETVPVPKFVAFGTTGTKGEVSDAAPDDTTAPDCPMAQEIPRSVIFASLPQSTVDEPGHTITLQINTAPAPTLKRREQVAEKRQPGELANAVGKVVSETGSLQIEPQQRAQSNAALPPQDTAPIQVAINKPATPQMAIADIVLSQQDILVTDTATDMPAALPQRTQHQLPTVQAPSEKPKPIQAVTTAEIAWRQKWNGSTTDEFGEIQIDKPPVKLTARTNIFSPTPPNLAPAPSAQPSSSIALNPGVIQNDPKIASIEPKGAKVKPTDTSLHNTESKFPASAVEQDARSTDGNSISISSPDQTDGLVAPVLPATNLPPQSVGAAPQTVIATVTPTIVEMVKSGTDASLELALSPEELGRLTISIRQEGDVVFVNLTADRPETLDLFRRHGNDLVADLRQAGFAGASLSFGQGGQGSQPRFGGPTPSPNDPSKLLHPPLEPTPRALVQALHGPGVDLRF